jgi:hypothetical protein
VTAWHENGSKYIEALLQYGFALWRRTWDENGVQTEEYRLAPDSWEYGQYEMLRRTLNW